MTSRTSHAFRIGHTVPSTYKNEQEILLKYNMGEKNKLETGYMGQDSVHEVQGTEAQTGFRRKSLKLRKRMCPLTLY